MGGFWSHVVEPGFFSTETVRIALLAGGIVAAVSGVTGVFTVLRGQSFAGHALGDISATGGSAAFLLSVNPFFGFLAMALIGAGSMEAIGIRRARGRDVATGIVLGAALGLSALFLYFNTTFHNTSGAAINVLFGSLFVITTSTVPVIIACGVGVTAVVLVLYRPLLLSSVGDDVARARGVPVRLTGAIFLLTMAVTVALAAITIGAILSTALLIGPAATALRVTKRPGTAMVTAAAVGVAATWVGCLLAYDSFYWPPVGHGWPVSFCIVAVIFVVYLAVDVGRTYLRHHPGARQSARPEQKSPTGAPGSPIDQRWSMPLETTGEG
jgi:zinc/manganese transport system permease protein